MIGIHVLIIAVVVSVLVSVALTYLIVNNVLTKKSDSKVNQAEEKARGIIDEAVKTAEAKKRESLLEIKEESIKAKNDLDREIKERRGEIQASERRIEKKEANIDKKLEQVEKREAAFVTACGGRKAFGAEIKRARAYIRSYL